MIRTLRAGGGGRAADPDQAAARGQITVEQAVAGCHERVAGANLDVGREALGQRTGRELDVADGRGAVGSRVAHQRPRRTPVGAVVQLPEGADRDRHVVRVGRVEADRTEGVVDRRAVGPIERLPRERLPAVDRLEQPAVGRRRRRCQRSSRRAPARSPSCASGGSRRRGRGRCGPVAHVIRSSDPIGVLDPDVPTNRTSRVAAYAEEAGQYAIELGMYIVATDGSGSSLVIAVSAGGLPGVSCAR